MENQQRATVAFLCGCLNNNQKQVYTSVYDNEMDEQVLCNYVNNEGCISIFDYRRSCYLRGSYPSFIDYGVSNQLFFNKIDDNTYNIFDYNTGDYIFVKCNERTVLINDNSLGKEFKYTLD